MPREWTADSILEATRSFQPACVIVAAAELDLIGALDERPQNGRDLARAIHGDERATTMLADALTALGILTKNDGSYAPTPGVAPLFTEGDPASVLPMLRHQANCLRSWAQLAAVVRSGHRFDRPPSVRGADEDLRSFIEAMQVTSREVAPKVVAALKAHLGTLAFDHLLDIGGGPGTWTMAFLEANPGARGTLYDLPDVIPIGRKHIEKAGLGDRVTFASGDFMADEALPTGADLALVSAIAHQNSREQNRDLYAKVHRALTPGGHILIRDMVMDDAHTSPAAGAMFAINMLVNTESGGTYSLAETTEDLRKAGFGELEVIPGARDMDWVIRAARSA